MDIVLFANATVYILQMASVRIYLKIEETYTLETTSQVDETFKINSVFWYRQAQCCFQRFLYNRVSGKIGSVVFQENVQLVDR